MRGLNTTDIRSGRLACSLILITSLLIILYCHSYTRSFAMPVEKKEVQIVEEAKTTENTEIQDEIIEDTEVSSENENEALEEQDVAAAKDVEAEEVEITEYDIPTSFVNPVTGNTVKYKGGKTIERTAKITYGDAGEINRLASPDKDGFMKLDDRYLIAVGSHFDTEPGQYIDLVLENGVVIQCIMGDLKADEDTDNTNIFTYHSRCCSEFIIDENSIRSDIYERGNASLKNSQWDSPVASVVVYDECY